VELEKHDPEKLKDTQFLKDNYAFTGELFLGHLRYGTFGGNSIENCHPFLRQNNWMTRNLVVAGNFNLTNVDELFNQLVDYPKFTDNPLEILKKHFDSKNKYTNFHMFEDCPECFKGVQLRKGVKYRNLNKHYFTFVEKLWVCEKIRSYSNNGLRIIKLRYNIKKLYYYYL
jgi:glutamine phosphoribosylpyrophosphate amidotransferase